MAEVVGYGATSDAYHPTAPHPEGLGARRAMQLALDDAGLPASAVDHINAHGTSTTLNDRTEAAAIRKVFGDHAPRIPITAVKSMTGHTIGAAGAVELVATVADAAHRRRPATINCDDPEDPDLNFVPHQPQRHDVAVAMSNSFGSAGHNATLVVRRYEQ
uniref:beta-ketoacyl-[acyl-carrier-protein] synthase family protein n=1 Tax=Sphingopyxis terrae TaxID=33052 RepID=UPI0036D2D37E